MAPVPESPEKELYLGSGLELLWPVWGRGASCGVTSEGEWEVSSQGSRLCDLPTAASLLQTILKINTPEELSAEEWGRAG